MTPNEQTAVEALTEIAYHSTDQRAQQAAFEALSLLEASPTVPVIGKEQETCEWVHIIPDGIGSWYESSCGLIGDGPNQSWKYCPECGKKINLTVEEVES